MKINNLTQEQEAQIQQYYNEWYRIGTCTAPADRQREYDYFTASKKIVAD